MSSFPGPPPESPAGPPSWQSPGPDGPGHGPAATAPTSEETAWALSAHIGSLVAAWFALGLLAPLAVLLLRGGSSAFVRRHAVESLNFQISLLIYIIAGVVLVVVTLGLGLLVVVPLAVAALVVVILATMRASRGQDYRYPLTLRLVS